jgi:hypothetical protein
LISSGNKENMTGDVPGQNEWGRHGTRDDYKVCESDLRHGIASQGDMAASYAVSDEQGATKKGSGNRQ